MSVFLDECVESVVRPMRTRRTGRGRKRRRRQASARHCSAAESMLRIGLQCGVHRREARRLGVLGARSLRAPSHPKPLEPGVSAGELRRSTTTLPPKNVHLARSHARERLFRRGLHRSLGSRGARVLEKSVCPPTRPLTSPTPPTTTLRSSSRARTARVLRADCCACTSCFLRSRTQK